MTCNARRIRVMTHARTLENSSLKVGRFERWWKQLTDGGTDRRTDGRTPSRYRLLYHGGYNALVVMSTDDVER